MKEQTFSIKSKLYVKPKRTSFIIKQVLSICLIITLIMGIIKIIFDGLSISIVGEMVLAFIVVSGYNSKTDLKPHYESTIADINFNDYQITIEYKQIEKYYKDTVWIIKTNEVNTMEFSDKLNCLHIIGNVYVMNKNKNAIIRQEKEHFLYIEKGFEQDILSEVNKICEISIKFMDR